MNEITRVALDNEMDLILVHRQSMKILELAGMSVSAQTTFATAVSEIAREAIEKDREALLILSISNKKDREKKIRAVIRDGNIPFLNSSSEGYRNAKRLVDYIGIDNSDGPAVVLDCHIPFNFRIDDALVEKWVILFNTDPEVTPYEEIKRKNRQLKDLSSQLIKSEDQYRTLTNSLPLMIFTLNDKGEVTYANSWLQEYTGQTIETLNETRWKEVVHPDDMQWERWDNPEKEYVPVSIERRLKDHRTNEYRWYTGIITPVLSEAGELQYWTAYLADIHAQKTIEAALKDNVELKETQRRLEENIRELNRSNNELEQFAYVASHDLQEPLRKISFYSDYLQNTYAEVLNSEGSGFVDNINKAADRMRILIHDILAYSTISKEERKFTRTDLNAIAREALHDLEITIREKNAVVDIDPLPEIEGNENQLKQLFENILSNSLKYTTPGIVPHIRISCSTTAGSVQLSFTDNGIGFEEKYLAKMFTLFQRLHGKDVYMGTGIGLSICKKIVDIHNGKITAQSRPGEGATFIVTLPVSQHSK